MKLFLAALLAFAMIAGCNKTEDDVTESGPKTVTSSEDPTNGDTEQPAEEETDGDSEEASATDDSEAEPSDDSASTTSALGLSADDLVGEWTGTDIFDEADRAILKSQGRTDQQIDAGIAQSASISQTLVLYSDMTYELKVDTPQGADTIEGTWSIASDSSITVIMKIPPSQSNPTGGEWPRPVKVSEDRKTLEMGDPEGTLKSKTVFKKSR